MSKLFNTYLNLKKEQPNTLFLFKTGMFYIFLDNDARLVNSLLNLKLTNLTPTVQKCGFPTSSLNKYISLLENMNHTTQIIDTANCEIYKIKDYQQKEITNCILQKLANVDVETLSIKHAYNFIEELHSQAQKILNES